MNVVKENPANKPVFVCFLVQIFWEVFETLPKIPPIKENKAAIVSWIRFLNINISASLNRTEKCDVSTSECLPIRDEGNKLLTLENTWVTYNFCYEDIKN